MRREDEGLRLGGVARGGSSGLLGRLLSYVATAAFLILVLTFSVAIFAVLAVAGLVVGGWFWWKTRALRRQLQAAEEAWGNAPSGMTGRPGAGAAATGGNAESGVVIEGEAIHVSEETAELPRKPGASR